MVFATHTRNHVPTEGQKNDLPSRTQQHFGNEVNINTIIGKYNRTGVMPRIQGNPQYGDFTGLDFHQAQNKIAEATQAFAQLPAYLRRKFNNDPAQLVDFIMDEGNREQAIRLGLIERKEEKKDVVPNSDASGAVRGKNSDNSAGKADGAKTEKGLE